VRFDVAVGVSSAFSAPMPLPFFAQLPVQHNSPGSVGLFPSPDILCCCLGGPSVAPTIPSEKAFSLLSPPVLSSLQGSIVDAVFS
jgi:hypothetical protein